MIEEVWQIIPEFPEYQISNLGRVYSERRDHIMRTSCTEFGNVKITLTSNVDNQRYTRSVSQLVAEAFVEPLLDNCDSVVLLDGDLSNVAAENIVWRPRWYAWKYTRQLKTEQPIYFQNLPVIDVKSGRRYESIIEAGMKEGLLFADIWRSTYSGAVIFPNRHIFAIDK